MLRTSNGVLWGGAKMKKRMKLYAFDFHTPDIGMDERVIEFTVPWRVGEIILSREKLLHEVVNK